MQDFRDAADNHSRLVKAIRQMWSAGAKALIPIPVASSASLLSRPLAASVFAMRCDPGRAVTDP